MAAGTCRGWRHPLHTVHGEAANSPLRFINFTRVPCTKGGGKAVFACKWLTSLRGDRDVLALQGLSGVSKTGPSAGQPRQTESHVPAQRPRGKSSLEKVHQEQLRRGKIKVSAAWSGSPPRSPQGDGSPPGPVPPWRTHPCSSITLDMAEPENLMLIQVNTCSSSGDVCAYVSSLSRMCWGMPGLSTGNASFRQDCLQCRHLGPAKSILLLQEDKSLST